MERRKPPGSRAMFFFNFHSFLFPAAAMEQEKQRNKWNRHVSSLLCSKIEWKHFPIPFFRLLTAPFKTALAAPAEASLTPILQKKAQDKRKSVTAWAWAEATAERDKNRPTFFKKRKGETSWCCLLAFTVTSHAPFKSSDKKGSPHFPKKISRCCSFLLGPSW